MLSTNPALLITDDDRDFRETLREVFETRGYQTFLAGDGLEAVEVLRRREIHVALFDMHMPRLDGLGAVRWIRESHLPVRCILLSAALDENLQVAAQEADVFASLPKPVSFRDLTRLVAQAMES